VKIFVGIVLVIVLGWFGITTRIPSPPSVEACTEKWFAYLDDNYFTTSDSEGHGPDVGSGEWLNSVERQAKLTVRSDLPNQTRCEHIQTQLRSRTFIVNRALGRTYLL
jgi:hypothetical protein